MFSTVTGMLALAAFIFGTPVVLGGMIWMIVALFRLRSVRRPLATVLLGITMSWLGGMLLFSGMMGTLSEFRGGLPNASGSDAPSMQDDESTLSADTSGPVAVPTPDIYANLVTATIRDKRYVQQRDGVRFRVRFDNISAGDIAAITGRFQFEDPSGTRQYSLNVRHGEQLNAGKFKFEEYWANYDQFDADEVWLRATSLEDMTVTFEPESVIFTDGTQIGDAR